jgi:hypothetical protein
MFQIKGSSEPKSQNDALGITFDPSKISIKDIHIRQRAWQCQISQMKVQAITRWPASQNSSVDYPARSHYTGSFGITILHSLRVIITR